MPVGEVAAGGLRAAFQDMADQAAGTEPVVIVRGPAEFMHQNAERQRAVGATAGDDDVGARGESGCDRQRAEIGVCSQELGRQAGDAEVRRDRQHIIALDRRDLQRQAEFDDHRLQRRLAAGRVHAAGIGGDLDPPAVHVRQSGLEIGDEVRRKTERRVLHARARQQRHGYLGQVVHHQVINAGRDQLRYRPRAVAPGTGGAADADGVLQRMLISSCARAHFST